MKNKLKDLPISTFEYVIPPMSSATHESPGVTLPTDLSELLAFANGFITKDRMFRVFGMGHDDLIQSIKEWNDSDWKASYGPLARDLLFIAEDIFGDQYGYSFRAGEQFIKFNCEGGEIEILAGGMDSFIDILIDPIGSGAIDGDLIETCRAKGIWPKANEHIAFKVPLIVGGECEASNIVIESAELHLGTLGQLSLRNKTLGAGTVIDSFSSNSR